MKLCKAFAIGCVFGFVACVSLPSMASAQTAASSELPYRQVQQIWSRLDPAQQNMVDLLAADFFKNDLSAQQRSRIVVSGAEQYRQGSAQSRNEMRNARRQEWQSMSEAERRKAQVTAGGSYSVLTDQQKAPFRLYAIDKLGLRPAAAPGPSSRGSAV